MEFNYDHMGRRIEKKVFSGNTLNKHLKFVYNGYKLIAELDGQNNNTVLRRYIWHAQETGFDTPYMVSDMTSNQSYLYIFDNNKNITALADVFGGTTVEYEYDAFGSIRNMTGNYAATNPFRFSSEYHDDETGLVYYNYRYYNPEIGRWISRDPIEEEGGVNLYGFVGNNPTSKTDSLGLYFPTGNPYQDVYYDYLTKKYIKPRRSFRDIADQASEQARRLHRQGLFRGESLHGMGMDAMRHCIWQCEMTREYGSAIAESVGDLYEIKGIVARDNSSLDTHMDLNNNKIGRELGSLEECKDESCEDICLGAFGAGKLNVIHDDTVGLDLDFDFGNRYRRLTPLRFSQSSQ